MRTSILFILSLFIGVATVHAADALTLKEAYRLTVKHSEELAIKQQQIKEAEGRFLQALSGALPKASFNYTDKYSENAGMSPEAKFTFSQPLFSGFKEFAAMSGSRAESRQRKEEEKRARQVLFVDVSDAFYYYGLYQEQLKSKQMIVDALSDRMGELKKRVDLGRSRLSELVNAEARLRRAEADLEQISSEMSTARELLEFLIAGPVSLIKMESNPAFAPKTDQELANFASSRLDVAAAREALMVSEKKVTVARAGFMPTVSAEGNYYTKKIIRSSADWDLSLKVSVPLFQGGDDWGKMKEASALVEESKLVLSETERKALLEARQAYAQWGASTRRSEALKKAVNAADKNFELQKADYGNNLVNNLDVLQSLEDLESARRDYIDASNATERLYWQFKVKAGDLNDVNL